MPLRSLNTIRLRVRRYLRQRFRRLRHELRRPREIVVGQQALEHDFDDLVRVGVGDLDRVEARSPRLRTRRAAPWRDRPRRSPSGTRRRVATASAAANAMRRRARKFLPAISLRAFQSPETKSRVMYHFRTVEARPIRPEIDRTTAIGAPLVRAPRQTEPFPCPEARARRQPSPNSGTRRRARSARRDRVLRRLIRAHPDIHLVRRGDPFTTLARAIVGQQISVASAAAVWARVVGRRGSAAQAARTAAPVGRARRRDRSHDPARMRIVAAQGRISRRPRRALRVRHARSGRTGTRSTTRH